jgi:hypothetical protein
MTVVREGGGGSLLLKLTHPPIRSGSRKANRRMASILTVSCRYSGPRRHTRERCVATTNHHHVIMVPSHCDSTSTRGVPGPCSRSRIGGPSVLPGSPCRTSIGGGRASPHAMPGGCIGTAIKACPVVPAGTPRLPARSSDNGNVRPPDGSTGQSTGCAVAQRSTPNISSTPANMARMAPVSAGLVNDWFARARSTIARG